MNWSELSFFFGPDVCTNNPCQNGGTCSQRFNRAICRCPAGYLGDRCETVGMCEFLEQSATTREDCKNGACCVVWVLGMFWEAQKSFKIMCEGMRCATFASEPEPASHLPPSDRSSYSRAFQNHFQKEMCFTDNT